MEFLINVDYDLSRATRRCVTGKNGGSGMHLVLHFNTEEDSKEWNTNHKEKCDPGE